MVPNVAFPPSTPFTDHVNGPETSSVTLNCCVPPSSFSAVAGAMVSPTGPPITVTGNSKSWPLMRMGTLAWPGVDVGASPRMMPLRSLPAQLMNAEVPAQRFTATTGITLPLRSSGITSTSILLPTSTTKSAGMVSIPATRGVSSMSACATVGPTVTAASPPVCV